MIIICYFCFSVLRNMLFFLKKNLIKYVSAIIYLKVLIYVFEQ